MLKCLKGKRLKLKYAKRLFKSVKVVTVGTMVLSSIPLIPGVYAAGGTYLTHKSDKGDVFIGGEYIELGVSMYGTFGSKASPDESLGFHNNSKMLPGTFSTIGMIANENGWSSGLKSSTCDFFLPGTVDEGWSFAYTDKSGNKQIAWAASTSIGSVSSENIEKSSTDLIEIEGKKAVQTVAYLFKHTPVTTKAIEEPLPASDTLVEETPEVITEESVVKTVDEVIVETKKEEVTVGESEVMKEEEKTELTKEKSSEISDEKVESSTADIPHDKTELSPNAKFKLTLIYSFDVNQKGFKTTVKVEKLVDEEMSNIRYARAFDPDQNAEEGSYLTYQFIENSTDKARITSYGRINKAAFIFDSKDPRAKAGCYPELRAIKDGKINEFVDEKYTKNTTQLTSDSAYSDDDIFILFDLDKELSAKSTTTTFSYDSLLDAYLGIVNSVLGDLPETVTIDNIYSTAPKIENVFHTYEKLSEKEKGYVDSTKASKIPELHTKSHDIIKKDIVKPIVDFANTLPSTLTNDQITKAKNYLNQFTKMETELYISEIRDEDKALFNQYEKAKDIIAKAASGKATETVTKPTTPVEPSKKAPKTNDVTQIGPYTQLVGLSAFYLFIDKKNRDILNKYKN